MNKVCCTAIYCLAERKIVKMTEWLNRARKGGQEDKRAENIVRTSALAFDETMARKLFFKNDSIARKGVLNYIPSYSAIYCGKI